MSEQPIIQPVDKALLKSELTPDKQLRMTNKSNNEIYIVTAHNAPHTMREIGRLREEAFREAGGGTGMEVDIDEFDTCENCYKQLIVWNPETEEIIGGYRYLLGTDWELSADGQPKLATSHMFHFSEKFLKEYMPYTIELGRSFVSLGYQSSRMGAKSLFALDNLWDGLGALTVVMPNVKYFFGKMTMYPSYIRKGRDMILYFLKKHFDDKENLITPMKPLKIETDPKELASILTEDDFRKDYRILNAEIRKMGYNIPPLVNAYMNLSPTMKLFGTAIMLMKSWQRNVSATLTPSCVRTLTLFISLLVPIGLLPKRSRRSFIPLGLFPMNSFPEFLLSGRGYLKVSSIRHPLKVHLFLGPAVVVLPRRQRSPFAIHRFRNMLQAKRWLPGHPRICRGQPIIPSLRLMPGRAEAPFREFSLFVPF